MKPMHFHNTLKCALLAGLLGGLGALNSHGQYTFNSGSDGSYGPMDVTTNTTLELPPNGIFHCTTIAVASNATLNFTPNALNTPVYLLATGDVTINGTIDVSGSKPTNSVGGVGGPGGFAGGNGAHAGLPASDGKGPGAGKVGGTGGGAAFGSTASGYRVGSQPGEMYGSPLNLPLVGGSGGSGWESQAGTGGGGAILVASSTRIDIAGSIAAAGPVYPVYEIDSSFSGLGSGGAIRLVTPVITGSGALNVNGGQNFGMCSWGACVYAVAGAGRIRLDCMDRRSLALNLSGTSSIGANMVVFPTNAPHLDITQVAGNSIPVGTGSAVSFTLPQDSPTNQTVTVQASNFGAPVPIRVVLTPDNGPSSSYDADIDNTVNPASVTVPVVVPVNVQVHVNAWTR